LARDAIKSSYFINKIFIFILYYTNQPGPGAAWEKFDELTLHKVFFPMTRLGFGVWGTPGSWDWVGGVMLVLRTFPELVGRSVQNLVEIGPAVQA